MSWFRCFVFGKLTYNTSTWCSMHVYAYAMATESHMNTNIFSHFDTLANASSHDTVLLSLATYKLRERENCAASDKIKWTNEQTELKTSSIHWNDGKSHSRQSVSLEVAIFNEFCIQNFSIEICKAYLCTHTLPSTETIGDITVPTKFNPKCVHTWTAEQNRTKQTEPTKPNTCIESISSNYQQIAVNWLHLGDDLHRFTKSKSRFNWHICYAIIKAWKCNFQRLGSALLAIAAIKRNELVWSDVH